MQTGICTTPPSPRAAAKRRGFTLVEMLVSIAVVSLLIAILIPSLSSAIGMARGFQCQMNQRSIAFDFAIFADNMLQGGRGNDELLGRDRFTIETFQESIYGIDEFWRYGEGTSVWTSESSDGNPMHCPSVRENIELRSNAPCSAGGVSPPAAVAFAFNLRLHRDEFEVLPNRFGLRPMLLTQAVLQDPEVPLLMDTDGAAAAMAGVPAMYAAPGTTGQSGPSSDPASGPVDGPISGGQFWFPAARHNGRVNVAFIGGHVRASTDPAAEGWRWLPTMPR